MKGYSVPSLRRVNSEQAHLVASAYAAAPSVASDPNVGAAYAELSDQARGWFARLTTDQAPQTRSCRLHPLPKALQ